MHLIQCSCIRMQAAVLSSAADLRPKCREFAFREADFFLLTLCPDSQRREQRTPDLTCEHDRLGCSGNHAVEATAKLDWDEKIRKRERSYS